MKIRLLLRLLSIAIALPCLGYAHSATPANTSAVTIPAGNAPLVFTPNRGQVTDAKGAPRPDVLFTTHSAAMQVFLTAGGLYYQFVRTTYADGHRPTAKGILPTREQAGQKAQVETHRVLVSLKGANAHPQIITEGQTIYTENFYLPQCPGGITHVPTYTRLIYKNVYPHIDWVVYSNKDGLKYDFVVHPGGNPQAIKLEIKDADSVCLTPQGALHIKTSLGTITEQAPVSYTEKGPVPSSFRQMDDGTIGFDVAAKAEETLTIDPTIAWATYYGGSADDAGIDCMVDDSNHVYMIGSTASTTAIASAGGYQTTMAGVKDACIVKFSSAGTRLWATYYGGTDEDWATAGCISRHGYIYIAGTTASASGMATTGAHQTTQGGGNDAFLARFTPAGTRVWSTCYGGTDWDHGFGCATDTADNVFLCGYTASFSGIAYNGYKDTLTWQFPYITTDGYVAKFDSAGRRLWGTYWGGNGFETLADAATDKAGNLYLCGVSTSPANIATPGCYQDTFGGNFDAILVKFTNNGARSWATYFGGIRDDWGYSCTADADDKIYITGYTATVTGLGYNAFRDTSGGYGDAFLAKFDTTGKRIWSTYYGGPVDDEGKYVATDSKRNIYMAGVAYSASNIAHNGFKNTISANIMGYGDAFISKFDSAGNRLWASYYGGNSDERSLIPYKELGCATGRYGDVFLVGGTLSASGIASGGYQNTFGGNFDAFLAKIRDCQDVTATVYDTACPPYIFGGHSYDTSGTYTHVFANALGCDSTVTLHLLIPKPAATIYDTACISYTYNGSQYDTSGTYTHTFTTPAGCDSTVTLYLTIRRVDTAVVQHADTLRAQATNASYQWLKCGGDYMIMRGDTTNTFTPAQNGLYAVEIIQNGCKDTSGCYNVQLTSGIAAAALSGDGIKIYPNPNHGSFTLLLPAAGFLPCPVMVYDAIGRVVYTQQLQHPTETITLQQPPRGIYLLKIRTTDAVHTRQLVIQ